MTDHGESPEWELLPNNPAAFFGLPAEFDRRQLRERYNALIRQFKPEKHPQEFQRIRAAYEDLEQLLRYGTDAVRPAAPVADSQWVTIDLEQVIPQQSPRRAAASPVVAGRKMEAAPIHVRLLSEPAADVYREYENLPRKSPCHYYALALLSDVVQPSELLGFSRWLLQGIRAYPNELGLIRLLHYYVRGPVPDELIDTLLEECASALHENTFFPLTEPLWERLARTDMERFGRVLAACETHLHGIHVEGRIAFLIRILRIAIWQGESEWTSQSMRFIDENFQKIPRQLEYDVEILATLAPYMSCRRQFVTGNSLRQRLDQALQNYFTEDQQTGDRSVLECQALIVQDVAAMSEAFARFDDPTMGPFYALWWMVNRDVAARSADMTYTVGDDALWRRQAANTIDSMFSLTRRSRAGRYWEISEIGYFGKMVLCFAVPAIAMSLLGIALGSAFTGRNDESFFAFLLIGCLAIGGVMTRYLSKELKRRWAVRREATAKRCYWEVWQSRIMEFAAQSRLPHHRLIAYLRAVPTARGSQANWAKQLAEQDYGLAMYVLALHFLI